ncbi:MAG: amidohydrolase [Thermomicrobiales bacterium]|nr:amidohydrolase [Thermomicrobiales bacterium]
MSNNLLLVNGRFKTMNPAQPTAEAVAMQNGIIIAVGSNDDARAVADRNSDVLDLGGRTATPGLNDAHAHPMMLGMSLDDLPIASPPVESIAQIVSMVAGAAERRPNGRWIIGRGYDQARLRDQRHPTRADLDAVSPHHPVLLFRACHHIGVANSAALALAGIDESTGDPDGGQIDRDEAGMPTGVVRETALGLVQEAIAEPTGSDLERYIERGLRAFQTAGVTSTVEAGIDRPEELRAYQSLWRAGSLPIRTYLMMIIAETLDEMIELGIQTGFGDPWLRIGPAKLFSDGSIGGRTARMRTPYARQADNVGLWMQEPNEMKRLVRKAHSAGFQVGIHAIGDAAIDLILDAYEEAQTADPRPDPRHRIEHCSIVDVEIIDRIARLGVVPIPGTSFLYYFRDAYLQNLGMERIRHTYGMRTFADHGVVAAASTDAPVVPPNPMTGIQTMMTRTDQDGHPTWPEEAIGLDEALRAYTVNGAWASFEEGIKGTLEPGKLGDVTVFDTDLDTVAAGEIGQVRVDHTIIDGTIVCSS